MLKNHTSFKIGGPADLFIYVNNQENLAALISQIAAEEIPFFILGNGSNLLVSDEGFNGIILYLNEDFKSISLKENCTIECGSGATLAKVCVFAMQNDLSGLEFAWGIPGSCGGALFMNAGAYGKEISDVVLEASHLTSQGVMQTLTKDDMMLSYRKSLYSENSFIITSLKLKLDRSNHKEIKNTMHQTILKRKSKQPLQFPSAGSVFKRPGGGYFAGALIESAGLKGAKIGGAMVSTKHSGFIVNTGNATAQDVSKLIKLIKEKVYLESGILLECEIKTLGNIKI